MATPPPEALPNLPTRYFTQSEVQLSSTGMQVSAGSLFVMSVPSGLTPFPKSGQLGSVFCWGPYFATEKLEPRVRDFPTKPMTLTERRVLAPTARSVMTCELNSDSLGYFALVLGAISKNQSSPRSETSSL